MRTPIDLDLLIIFLGFSGITLPFLYLIHRVSYPSFEYVRLNHVYAEVILVLAPAFIANAWRTYSAGAYDSGSPFNLVRLYSLIGAYFLFPIVSQIIVRKRTLGELGFSKITNWKAAIILWLWAALLFVGSAVYRFLVSGRVSFPLLAVAPVLSLGLLGEEQMFRGFIQTRLETVQGVQRAWVLSSLLFGLIHVWNFFVIGVR